MRILHVDLLYNNNLRQQISIVIVCPRTYSSGDPIKNLKLVVVVVVVVVGARAHRMPRGSKLFWLFHLVGVDCFGYV